MTTPAPASVPLRIERQADATLVASGEIDLSAVPVLREALENTDGGPLQEQVLDLRGVTFLDSAGLGVIFQHAHRLRVIVAPGSVVARVVGISGLTHAAQVQFQPL